jgi:hypothetical protein
MAVPTSNQPRSRFGNSSTGLFEDDEAVEFMEPRKTRLWEN